MYRLGARTISTSLTPPGNLGKTKVSYILRWQSFQTQLCIFKMISIKFLIDWYIICMGLEAKKFPFCLEGVKIDLLSKTRHYGIPPMPQITY